VRAVPGSRARLGATDAAYVQLAIPQAESALPLLDLVRQRSGDPALVALATRAADGHRGELTRLHGVLDAAGLEYLDEHAGHDMPGMVTEAEVAAAGALTGPDFDAQARTLLKAHFEESKAIAAVEREAGSDAEVLGLTADLERARADYLANLSGS
jgi:uncharacterized protein (DUF305 family)